MKYILCHGLLGASRGRIRRQRYIFGFSLKCQVEHLLKVALQVRYALLKVPSICNTGLAGAAVIVVVVGVGVVVTLELFLKLADGARHQFDEVIVEPGVAYLLQISYGPYM